MSEVKVSLDTLCEDLIGMVGLTYTGEVSEVRLNDRGTIRLYVYTSAGDVMVRIDDRVDGQLSTSWRALMSESDVYDFYDEHVLFFV